MFPYSYAPELEFAVPALVKRQQLGEL